MDEHNEETSSNGIDGGEGETDADGDDVPYTVVVQIPNPYGEGNGENLEDPIYVFSSNAGQGTDQARMSELYRAVTSVEGQDNGNADESNLEEYVVLDTEVEEGGEGDMVEQEEQGEEVSNTSVSSSQNMMGTPVRIITHPHAKSLVWNHFGFLPIGDTDTPDRRRTVCKLCLRELPYCGNTTNLQYHLQRYHKGVLPPGVREIKVARNPRRVSRLPAPLGDPANVLCISPNPADARSRSKRRTATTPSTSTTLTTVSENDLWHWQVVRKQQLTQLLMKALVTDCLPLQTLEGPGFQSLIHLLDPQYEIPTPILCRSTLLPTMYSEEKRKVMNSLQGAECYALSLDVWRGGAGGWCGSARTKDSDATYLGVAVHYVDPAWNIDNRYLGTLEVLPGQDSEELSRNIQRLLNEWRLNLKWSLTGCTAPEYSILPHGVLSSALGCLHLPQVPCLLAALQYAANKCLTQQDVEMSLMRVRSLLTAIESSTPPMALLRGKVHEKLTAHNQTTNLSFHKSASWPQIYQLLEKIYVVRDLVVGPELPFLTNNDLISIEALIMVLRPLQEAAETLSGELYPSVSLVLPLLYKLTNVNLIETADDSALLSDLKSVTRIALRNVYEREEGSSILKMSMFLDPRLKRLPFFSKSEKSDVHALIRKQLSKVVKKQNQGASNLTHVKVGGTSAAPSKKPKLAALLHDIFADPDQAARDSSPALSMPDNIAQSELTCYENEEAVSLEESQPLHWWKAREGQYKFLSKLAKRVLCFSAVATPTRRLMTSEGVSWAGRRGALPCEDAEHFLFLSENFAHSNVEY